MLDLKPDSACYPENNLLRVRFQNMAIPDMDTPSLAALRRIADALGVTVERFFTEEPSLEAVTDADACLRLWSKITTEEGRRQALKALRVIVEMEQR